MAERYADGKGTEEDLALQMQSALDAYGSACFASQDYPIKWKDNPFSQMPVRNITRAVEATQAVVGTVDPHLGKEGQEHFGIDEIVKCVVEAWGATVAEAHPEATLVREIFGDPFRPVKAEPEWLTSDVVALARDIYAKRAFDRMGILADALQDAGCDNTDVLGHCYEHLGEHVRGCWVVDMLLGKG
jgi:hypothetical protein